MAQEVCRAEVPPLNAVAEEDGTELVGRGSACHFWKETLHG